MADNGVVCSMIRQATWGDNAAMDSFFSSLKTERTANKTYKTRDDARARCVRLLRHFYNSNEGTPRSILSAMDSSERA